MGSEGRDRIERLSRFANAHDTKILEYLAFISVKYDVDFEELFSGIVDAWKREISSCGNLQIKCRGEFHDKIVFLITLDGNVATQFRLPESLLKEGELLGEYVLDMRLHSSS